MDRLIKPINALLTKSRQNTFLALSIGIVYLWFGTLKFFPHLSPAEGLAMDTIHLLTFGYLPSHIAIFLLAMMEVVIGFCFILNIFRRGSIILALFHMACTFTPLFFFAEESFVSGPLVPTLLGQYIGKNLIIVAALLSMLKAAGKSAEGVTNEMADLAKNNQNGDKRIEQK
ncbi:MAG: hypothetical protein WBN18_14005 [Flavobacteriaceae bacterium]